MDAARRLPHRPPGSAYATRASTSPAGTTLRGTTLTGTTRATPAIAPAPVRLHAHPAPEPAPLATTDAVRHMVIAGASGVVGHALARAAPPRWRVTVLTRRRDGSEPEGTTAVAWRPDAARHGDETRLDRLAEVLDGADAVVNLAGAPIDAGRFGRRHRRAVLQSRVDATTTLLRAVERTDTAPAVWLQASAAGIYGDRGDEVLDERSPLGHDFFLSEVCRAWEGAAAPAARHCRLVVGRQGIVLARDARAWRKLTLPIRLFVGGRLASGRQWWPWIHVDDLTRAMLELLEPPAGHDASPAQGVYVLAAPEPVRQIDLARAVGRALGRPVWTRAPALALRAAVGGLADLLLLPSQRLRPARLIGERFRFLHPTIDDAVRDLLRR